MVRRHFALREFQQKVVLPAPYAGPMDFALDEEWDLSEQGPIEYDEYGDRVGKSNYDLIPKTVIHTNKVKPANLTGCKLSVCEICFLNAVHRILNQHLEKTHCILYRNQMHLLETWTCAKKSKASRKFRKRQLRFAAKAKQLFHIKSCISSLRFLLETLRLQLPAEYREHLQNLAGMLVPSHGSSKNSTSKYSSDARSLQGSHLAIADAQHHQMINSSYHGGNSEHIRMSNSGINNSSFGGKSNSLETQGRRRRRFHSGTYRVRRFYRFSRDSNGLWLSFWRSLENFEMSHAFENV